MSLSFNLAKVKDWDAKFSHPTDPDHRWSPVVDSMLTMMTIAGVSHIDAKNLDLVKRRIRQVQTVTGAPMANMDGDIWVTDADVEELVGFETNISDISETEWLKKLGRMADENFWHCGVGRQKCGARDLIEYYNVRLEDGTFYVMKGRA
jgi:hypothetical protein